MSFVKYKMSARHMDLIDPLLDVQTKILCLKIMWVLEDGEHLLP